MVAHLAVEALLTATHPGEEVGDVYAAVQANNDLYGFRLGVTALNSIAREVGRSDLAAFALAEIGE